MPIDILAPGEAENPLREALRGLVNPPPVQINVEGVALFPAVIPLGNATGFLLDGELVDIVAKMVEGDFGYDIDLSGATGFEVLGLGWIDGDFGLGSKKSILLESLLMPDLIGVSQDLGLYGLANLSEYDFSSLVYIGDEFYWDTMPNPVADFPALRQVNYMAFYNNPALETALFPNLRRLFNLYTTGCTSASSFQIPTFERCYGDFNLSGFESLASFAFPESVVQLGGLYFNSCILDQESVDGILATLVRLDGTNGTQFWNHYAYLANTNAAPSTEGLADLAILQGRGAYIEVST